MRQRKGTGRTTTRRSRPAKRNALEGGAEALFTKTYRFVMLRSQIDMRVESAA
jgi:hypothetical protein